MLQNGFNHIFIKGNTSSKSIIWKVSTSDRCSTGICLRAAFIPYLGSCKVGGEPEMPDVACSLWLSAAVHHYTVYSSQLSIQFSAFNK